MKRRLSQSHVGIDDGRMTDDRQHRQVAHAVGVSKGIAQANPLALGVSPDPGSLRRGSHDRRQQSPGGHAIHKLEPVRHVLCNAEVFHQRLDRQIESAGDYYLPQSQTARLLNQLVSSGKDGRLDDVFEQVLGKVAEPVFGLALVTLEVEVVKDFSAILVRDREHRKAQKRGGAHFETGHQPLLTACVERKCVHQVGAHQCALKIVECCACQTLSSSDPVSHYTAFDLIGEPRTQKYYKLYSDARQSEAIVW